MRMVFKVVKGSPINVPFFTFMSFYMITINGYYHTIPGHVWSLGVTINKRDNVENVIKIFSNLMRKLIFKCGTKIVIYFEGK